jgi:toxin ParE1/3/4
LTASYVLTEAAEADLRGIIRYTSAQWGDDQVRLYASKLARGFERLASGGGGVRDMGALFPGLRMLRCEHHYIFGLPRADAPALIVAVFHERMDAITRVAHRLE